MKIKTQINGHLNGAVLSEAALPKTKEVQRAAESIASTIWPEWSSDGYPRGDLPARESRMLMDWLNAAEAHLDGKSDLSDQTWQVVVDDLPGMEKIHRKLKAKLDQSDRKGDARFAKLMADSDDPRGLDWKPHRRDHDLGRAAARAEYAGQVHMTALGRYRR